MNLVSGDEVALIGRGAPDGSVRHVGAEAYAVAAVAPRSVVPDGSASDPMATPESQRVVLTSIAQRRDEPRPESKHIDRDADPAGQRSS
jgi:hypothetical protein